MHLPREHRLQGPLVHITVPRPVSLELLKHIILQGVGQVLGIQIGNLVCGVKNKALDSSPNY